MKDGFLVNEKELMKQKDGGINNALNTPLLYSNFGKGNVHHSPTLVVHSISKVNLHVHSCVDGSQEVGEEEYHVVIYLVPLGEGDVLVNGNGHVLFHEASLELEDRDFGQKFVPEYNGGERDHKKVVSL